MCFSKVKPSWCFKFFFFNFLFTNLSVSRLLDTKLMASTQPFKVYLVMFFMFSAHRWMLNVFLSSRSWSPTPLWQSWRSSWRKAPSSHHKWVSKTQTWGRLSACERLAVMLVFPVQKPPRDSPVTTQPRSSSTRPATTPTSPACVSSLWPTISVTTSPLSFD